MTTQPQTNLPEPGALSEDAFIDPVFEKWAGVNDNGLPYLRSYKEQVRLIAYDLLAADRAQRVKVEPVADLRARCSEILDWQKTGTLKGSALHDFGKRLHGDDHAMLQMAEDQTAREAYAFVLATPQPAPGAVPVVQAVTTDARPVPSPLSHSFNRCVRVRGQTSSLDIAGEYLDGGTLVIYVDLPAPQAEKAPSAQAVDRQALIDAIAEGLRDTWHCMRVWEAWNVGTMSQDDFEPVDESDTPTELADKVLELLATPQPPAIPERANMRCRRCGDSYDITFSSVTSKGQP